MKLSIMFFSTKFEADSERCYDFILETARTADENGFHAIWLPERHFHPFGGIYPNPAVMASAIAAVTKRVRVRAGSVVIPLHHPVRVAEDWSMVDRLSDGRVDMSFSKGWNKTEFIFRTDFADYDDDLMFKDIEEVRHLWRGETRSYPTGSGTRELEIFPKPCNPELNFWVSTFNEQLYVRTANAGGNVLTALLRQTINELEGKIKTFRAASTTAQMTLMLHTYVAPTDAEAQAVVGEPFKAYLENSMTLWKQQFDRLVMPEVLKQKVLDFAVTRYLRDATLIGSVERVRERIEMFKAMGVDEIACLLDFGAPPDKIRESLALLSKLV